MVKQDSILLFAWTAFFLVVNIVAVVGLIRVAWIFFEWAVEMDWSGILGSGLGGWAYQG